MEIRKEFRYEMGHIVRNAWSRRCSMNAHGHSYRVEFLFDGQNNDNGQMLSDFGFLKKYLAPYVDAFDHSFWLWDRKEDKHIVDFFTQQFERIITSPFSTTAEMQAKLFYTYATAVINFLQANNMFENGEKFVTVSGVRVHETTTGYAEYRPSNKDNFPKIDLNTVKFSNQIISEWPKEYRDFYSKLTEEKTFYLEISGRQTGKTTRLIQRAIEYAKAGNSVVIYTHNSVTAELIVKLLRDEHTANIYVLPFCLRGRMAGYKLVNPLYMYDEGDFFTYPEDFEFESKVYFATTPKYIRTKWEKTDVMYKALCRSKGVYYNMQNPYTRQYPNLNELRGNLYEADHNFIPPIIYSTPVLTKFIANVDQINNS